MKTPNPTRRSERSRQAILSAAFDLVAEIGYAKLTVEAIAARAGVGKQTIYRWWPSKGAVFVEAVLDLSRDERGELALPDTGDLRADLRGVLRAIVDEYNDPKLDAMSRALSAEALADPALNSEITGRILGPILEATRERLRSARRAGQVAADADLSVAVELLFGPVYHRWMLRTNPLTHEYADTVVEFALRALAPTQGESDSVSVKG
ncbi:AcrR family transcriptional regulator [Streptosporangium becharense]|uniref:AcrR family transcriptional regulator n=1 Tax=Streptosporangium becharense TaxID=1816182 RepID=A0A7W9IDR3_9ACTN|nr:TetR/AcrR family transcriptional regulator [Streptosporangium becharense]MBB2912322.1 AcrR family transcriptional regulator [Streptosporangium becharense]MBB5818869.1 AcrR family transcriptional regulator [Streptosporangium becharense]